MHALFCNFTIERVHAAIPAAWEFAGPGAALTARKQGATAALRRQLGDLADGPEVAVAAELAAAAAPAEGRTLFAANRALPEPRDPVARLWHAATLLREHRGDGHIAAMVAAGIDGRESHVLQALANRVPRETYTVPRDFDGAEWADRLDTLRGKGLAGDGGVTEQGRAVKAAIETRTDAAAAPAYTVLAPRRPRGTALGTAPTGPRGHGVRGDPGDHPDRIGSAGNVRGTGSRPRWGSVGETPICRPASAVSPVGIVITLLSRGAGAVRAYFVAVAAVLHRAPPATAGPRGIDVEELTVRSRACSDTAGVRPGEKVDRIAGHGVQQRGAIGQATDCCSRTSPKPKP